MTFVLLGSLLVVLSMAIVLLTSRRPIMIWIMIPLLFSLAVLPRNLFQFGDDRAYFSDIAPSIPTVTTYVLVSATALLVIKLKTNLRLLPLTFPVLVGLLIVFLFTVWDGTPAQWSGFIVIVVGIMGWAIGRYAGFRLRVDSRAATAFLCLLLAILVFQLVIATAQRAGLLLPDWLTSEGRLAVEATGRVTGTLGHPANLSKIALLIMILALPWTVVSSKAQRWLSWLTVCAAILIGLMSISRSNIVGMSIILVLWILTVPGRLSLGHRLLALSTMAVAAVVLSRGVISRFLEDPEGGARPALLSAGLEQISRAPWFGTGPNAYIPAVAPFSPETALGYPVHNAFILAFAELGILGGMLLFYPMVSLFFLAWTNRNVSGPKYWCRAFLCSMPGMLLVLNTGWGLLSSQYLVLWFLISGIYSTSMVSDGHSSAPRSSSSGSNGDGTRAKFMAVRAPFES